MGELSTAHAPGAESRTRKLCPSCSSWFEPPATGGYVWEDRIYCSWPGRCELCARGRAEAVLERLAHEGGGADYVGGIGRWSPHEWGTLHEDYTSTARPIPQRAASSSPAPAEPSAPPANVVPREGHNRMRRRGRVRS